MSIRYKRIVVRSSATGTPTNIFVEESANIAAVLEKAGASSDKTDALVGGEVVTSDFVPEGDTEVVLQARKYSSGSFLA